MKLKYILEPTNQLAHNLIYFTLLRKQFETLYWNFTSFEQKSMFYEKNFDFSLASGVDANGATVRI